MFGGKVIARLVVLSIALIGCCGELYYVDSASNSTTNCGMSWEQACGSIQSGVAVACDDQSAENRELVVAPGNYTIPSPRLLVSCPLQITSCNGSRVTHLVVEQLTFAPSQLSGSNETSSLFGFSVTTRASNVTAIVFEGNDMVEIRDVYFQNVTSSVALIVIEDARVVVGEEISMNDCSVQKLLAGSSIGKINISKCQMINGAIGTLLDVEVEDLALSDCGMSNGAVTNTLLQVGAQIVDIANFRVEVEVALSTGQCSLLSLGNSTSSIRLSNSTFRIQSQDVLPEILRCPGSCSLAEVAFSDFQAEVFQHSGNLSLSSVTFRHAIVHTLLASPLESQWTDVSLDTVTAEQVIALEGSSSVIWMDGVTAANLSIRCFICGASADSHTVSIQNSSFTTIALPPDTPFGYYALWSFPNPGSLSVVEMASVYFEDIKMGIIFNPNVVTIKQCRFSRIAPPHQPAIFLQGAEQIEITNSTFQKCQSDLIIVQDVSQMSLLDTSFTNNVAEEAGVSALLSSVEVKNVHWANNTAQSAWAFGRFSSCNVTLIEFNATGNRGYLGGTLYLESSRVSLLNSTVSMNSASFGGAVFSQQTELSVTRSSFDSNGVSGDGGTLAIKDSIVTIDRVNISNSHADSNGGSVSLGGTAQLLGVGLSVYNSTATEGGCIAASSRASIDVSILELENCVGTSRGGGLLLAGYTNATIDEMTLTFSQAREGGGLYMTGSCTLYLSNSSVRSTSSEYGGGFYLAGNSTSSLSGVEVTNSRAFNGAGVLVTTESVATFQDCLFSGNMASSQGGSLSTQDRATATLFRCTLTNSEAKLGGAIYATDDTNLLMSESNFSKNNAFYHGGTLFATSGASIELYNSLLENNTAFNGTGGAISIQGSAALDAADCLIQYNIGKSGGAVYSSSERLNALHLSKCSLLNNTGDESGGAICLVSRSTAQISELVCQGNMADYGGCLASSGAANIINSSITHNSATTGGGYWIAPGGAIQDTESSLTGNSATNGGGAFVSAQGILQAEATRICDNRADLGGGILTVGLYSSSPSKLKYCQITQNMATFGGGLYIARTFQEGDNENKANKEAVFSERTADVPDHVFENLTIAFNHADRGGGIYVDDLSSQAPTFGPECLLDSNYAETLGGAIYFARYESTPFMFGGVFENNEARWGGWNIGHGWVITERYLELGAGFCINCTIPVRADPEGYGTSNGVASVPMKVQLFGCDRDYQRGENYTVKVYLVDHFSSTVRGDYLVDHPTQVTYEDTPRLGFFVVPPGPYYLPISDGIARITGQICYARGSSTIATRRLHVGNFTDSCSMSVSQCNLLNHTVEDDSCPFCVPVKESLISSNPWITILLLIIALLVAVLCVIGIVAAFAALERAVRRKQMDAIVIPDFCERPSLTLAEVLSDTSITQLKWDEVQIGMTIGKGASGLVSEGTWTPSFGPAQAIALKELIIGYDEITDDVLHEFLAEIKYMSALVHEKIVRFLGILLTPDESKLYLVTELMHKGSVRDLLSKKGRNIPPSIRLKMAKDAAEGVAHLHSKKLIHRDLKSHNLLVNDSWDTKVADFGISTVRPTITRAMTCIGTPVYMAPEVLSKNKYSEKADVFSFGVVLMEIFTNQVPYRHSPYDKMNQAMLMYHILEKEARPCIDGLHPTLQNIIQECWATDPNLRPTFSEVILRLKRLPVEHLHPPPGSMDSPSQSVDSTVHSIQSEEEQNTDDWINPEEEAEQ